MERFYFALLKERMLFFVHNRNEGLGDSDAKKVLPLRASGIIAFFHQTKENIRKMKQ